MTIHEIKVEALRSMAVNLEEDIRAEDYEALLAVDKYASYLVNMTGAINRCLSVFERRRVLPLKKAVLSGGTARGGCLAFDLAQIRDLYDIAYIVYDGDLGYDRSVAFIKEASEVLIPFPLDGTYTAVYYPTVPRVKESDGEVDIGLPEGLACLVPLAIKVELLAPEDPDSAALARSQFETALAEIMNEDRVTPSSVVSIYGGEML